jgi:hypothetical protein
LGLFLSKLKIKKKLIRSQNSNKEWGESDKGNNVPTKPETHQLFALLAGRKDNRHSVMKPLQFARRFRCDDRIAEKWLLAGSFSGQNEAQSVKIKSKRVKSKFQGILHTLRAPSIPQGRKVHEIASPGMVNEVRGAVLPQLEPFKESFGNHDAAVSLSKRMIHAFGRLDGIISGVDGLEGCGKVNWKRLGPEWD